MRDRSTYPAVVGTGRIDEVRCSTEIQQDRFGIIRDLVDLRGRARRAPRVRAEALDYAATPATIAPRRQIDL
jgi:hypothetical protein